MPRSRKSSTGTRQARARSATPASQPRGTRIHTLDDLQPDPLNANRGTDRGRDALRRSLEEHGAGRSIVVDARGRILGGNKTVEQAKALGLPVTVIPTDGQQLVVVQRIDLDAQTDPRGQALAVADNRVGELDLDWDPAMLQQLKKAGVALDGFWSPEWPGTVTPKVPRMSRPVGSAKQWAPMAGPLRPPSMKPNRRRATPST